MKNTVQKLLPIGVALLTSRAFAHEGHGSGATHDLQHNLWLVTAIFIVTFAYKLGQKRREED